MGVHTWKVRLIGELPLDQGDRGYLAGHIRDLVETESASEATRRLETGYGASFAAFLVLQGILGYREGDYWTDFCQRIPITLNTAQAWGGLFRRVVRTLGLPSFEDIGGAANLAPILAHGGIPNHSLPDFFQKVLLPSLADARYAGLDAQELLDLWRTRSELVLARPVMRFLLHGGSFARDFVARCLDMARDGLHAGRRAPASEYGLPERVVERFHKWLDEPDRQQVRGEPVESLRRPVLWLDPLGDGLCLDLPPQNLSGRCRSVAWVATTADGTRRVRASHDVYGDHCHVESAILPIDRPCDTLAVTLEVDGQARRTWEIRLWAGPARFLVFEAGTGRHLPVPPAHPREGLWILHQASLQVRWEDGNPCEWPEKFDLLPAWRSYRCGHLACDHPGVLLLQESGSSSPTRLDLTPGASTQLRLDGGTSLPAEASTDLPTWIGPPPDLCLPDSAAGSLCIHPEGSAQPGDVRIVPLEALPIEHTPNGPRISLRHPKLLGEHPIGTFHVALRGYLGQDTRCSLRVIPALAIHHRLTRRDSSDVDVTSIEVPRTVRVSQLGPAGFVPLDRHNDHSVEVPFVAGHAETELRLEWPLPNATSARIPLRITRRLWRWRLIGASQGETGWHQGPIEGAVEELLDDTEPNLVVDISPLGDNPLEVSLEFVDANHDPVIRPLRVFTEPRSASSIPLPPRVRFALGPHRDTLRSARSSIAGLLGVRKRGGPSSPSDSFAAAVLALQQSWRVQDVQAVAHREPSDDWSVHMQWNSPRKIRHRRMNLWPQSRPWERPQAHCISDAADQEHRFSLPADSLRPGHYVVELRVDDPWVSTPAARPPSNAPNTTILQVGSSAEVQQHLDALPASGLTCMEKCMTSLLLHGRYDVTTLYPLRESIHDDEIPLLLDLRLAIADMPAYEQEGLTQLEDFSRKFLVQEHGAILAQAIAHKAMDASRTLRSDLVQECVRLGLPYLHSFRASQQSVPSEVRQDLWRLWPPVAAILVPPDWEVARPEFTYHLGQASVQRLEEWEPGAGDLFGRAQPQEIPLDAERIRAISEMFPPPSEPLAADAYTHACLAWMRRATKNGPEASTAWARNGHARLRAWLDKGTKHDWLSPVFVQELERRRPPAHHALHNLVPYCVGALALLQITLARDSHRQKQSYIQPEDLRQDLIQAHALAPELLKHDLCLVELLLRMEHADSPSEEMPS